MTKEVTTKKENALSTDVQNQGVDQMLRSDMLIPYLTCAQGMSDAVKERKAQMGDIIRSTSYEKMGDPENPVEFILLGYPKNNWVIEQKEGSRFKFRRIEERNAANEVLPWYFWADNEGRELPEGAPGATEWRRVKQLLAFAILPADVAAAEAEMKKVEAGELPDPNKALTPVLISFRSTSYKAGKELTTFFANCKSMKIPVYRYKLKIGCTLEQNDEGSFYVWNVDRNRAQAVSKEHLPMIEEWAQIVTYHGSELKTHDEAEGDGFADVQTNAGPAPTAAARGEVI